MLEKETEKGFEDLNSFLYKKIKEMVKNNDLKAGEKIKQVEIAEKLGVSRTPLLKVLHKLASENIIEYIPNRGFKVKNLTVKELKEIYEVRELVQGVSARNVVKKAREKEIEELESYFLPFNKKTDINKKEYYEADKEFHRRLIELSRNKLIIKINKMFYIHNFSYQEGLLRPPEETIVEHLNLIKAIKNRNQNKAQRLAVEHIENSIKNISEDIV